jgi:hypothetical protein
VVVIGERLSDCSVGHPERFAGGERQGHLRRFARLGIEIDRRARPGLRGRRRQETPDQLGVGLQHRKEDQRQRHVEERVEVGERPAGIGPQLRDQRRKPGEEAQHQDEPGEPVQQVAERQPAVGGTGAHVALQHRVDRRAQVGPHDQRHAGLDPHHALHRQRHREQHRDHARMRRPGQ